MLNSKYFAVICILFIAFTCNIHADAKLSAPKDNDGIKTYSAHEAQRIFLEHLQVKVNLIKHEHSSQSHNENLIVIGTPEDNPQIKNFIQADFLKPINIQQGYSIRCAPNDSNKDRWTLVIAGADSNGVLNGLRDLEHYYLKNFTPDNGSLTAKSFTATDYPRIEYRGHWVWGCNMPDKKAWLENMSRWKMNELIHWDNYPPKKAKEYVDFAHSRGIRVIWGFGWGWNPDWNFDIPKDFDYGTGKGVQMCGSSEFNKKFYQREILKKVRDLYVPTGCDGIYFQAFTEVPKCQCTQCKAKSKGQIMLEFVNPIVDAIKNQFPDLWISCGVHANLGYYEEMKDLDPRCNIYWENCESATSIRGQYEDFGYINKTLPYSHGFSKTCPADPIWTEQSLEKWMQSNKQRYHLAGDIDTYYAYMRKVQKWSGNLLGKKSSNKHATTVADHSVFCRRTPFMHIALAESQWNPQMDTEPRVDAIVDFLGIRSTIPKSSTAKVQHDAISASATLKTKYSHKYPAAGDKALLDGKIASAPVVSDKHWQGYEGDNLEIIIDLGKTKSISSLSSAYLQCIDPAVFLPKQVEYTISNDGKNFNIIGTIKSPKPNKEAKTERKTYTIDGLDLDARYIRVKAQNQNIIPDWHRGKGRKAWLFVDEIMINPIITD